MAMKLDRNGAALSASFEGLFLYSYPDPGTGGEPITCGLGHTAAAGGIKPLMGQAFTMRQVMDMFRGDMGRVENSVNKAIHVPLGQPQFNVCCSFQLNTGAIATGSFDDKLNAGDQTAALAVLGQYTRAAGRVMQGLVNRRRMEIAIFKTGEYPSMKIEVRDRPDSPVRYISADALPWDVPEPPLVDLHIAPLPTAAVPVPPIPPKSTPATSPAPTPKPAIPPLPTLGRQNFIIDIYRYFVGLFRK